jgi:hypothetical protein
MIDPRKLINNPAINATIIGTILSVPRQQSGRAGAKEMKALEARAALKVPVRAEGAEQDSPGWRLRSSRNPGFALQRYKP